MVAQSRVNFARLAVLSVLVLALGAEPTRAQTPAGNPGGIGHYVLGPGDVLEVSVWGYPDLTRTAAVRPDGRISLPLVGDLKVAGLTVERVTQTLTQAYGRYIRSPPVTVIVKEFRRIQASVLGQVVRPGTYVLAPGSRLLDLLSAAGGVTDTASLKDAQLMQGGGAPVTVDLERVIAGDLAANLLLAGGETLVVREDLVSIVNVLGEVTKPGRYRLKGEVRVLDALLMAGGLTEKASLTQSRLVRGSRETIALNLADLLLRQDMSLNVPILPGDTLFIPEETNNRFFVLGDVNQPGAFLIKGEVTLLQAVAMAGGPVQRGPGTAKVAHIVRRNGEPGRAVAGIGKAEPLPNGGLLVTVDLQELLRQGQGAQTIPVFAGDVIVVPQSGLGGLQIILSILSGILGIFR